MSSAPGSGATPDHGCNVVQHDFLAPNDSSLSSSSWSSEVPNGDPASVPSNAVDSAGPSGPVAASRPDVSSQHVYADVVRGFVNSQPVADVPDEQDELPTHPLTVFFNPRSRIPANEVFEALQASGIDSTSVSCILFRLNCADVPYCYSQGTIPRVKCCYHQKPTLCPSRY